MTILCEWSVTPPLPNPYFRAVLLQETYDANWQAETGGRAVEIRREPVMGFMLLDLPAGRHDIRMHFAVPMENRVGQWLFGFSCLGILGPLLGGRRLSPV